MSLGFLFSILWFASLIIAFFMGTLNSLILLINHKSAPIVMTTGHGGAGSASPLPIFVPSLSPHPHTWSLLERKFVLHLCSLIPHKFLPIYYYYFFENIKKWKKEKDSENNQHYNAKNERQHTTVNAVATTFTSNIEDGDRDEDEDDDETKTETKTKKRWGRRRWRQRRRDGDKDSKSRETKMMKIDDKQQPEEDWWEVVSVKDGSGDWRYREEYLWEAEKQSQWMIDWRYI